MLRVVGRVGGGKGDYSSGDGEAGRMERRERRGEEVRCGREGAVEERRGTTSREERRRSTEEEREGNEKTSERRRHGRDTCDRNGWGGSRGDLDKSSLEVEKSSERERRRRGEQERSRTSAVKTVRVEEESSRKHSGEGRSERRAREEEDGRSHRREERSLVKRREEGSMRPSRSEEGLLSTAEVIVEREGDLSQRRGGMTRGEESRSSKRRSTETETVRGHRSQSVDRPERGGGQPSRRPETTQRGEERRRKTFTRSKSHDDFSEPAGWRGSTRRDSRDSRGESREGSSAESEPFYLHSPRQASTNGYQRIQSLFYEDGSTEGRKKSREDLRGEDLRQPSRRRRAAPSMPLPSIDYGGLSFCVDRDFQFSS